MDVLCSPSKMRPKTVEVIFVDDSDSPSSSYPHSRNIELFNEDSDSDINLISESESFVSTSDELIVDESSDDSNSDDNSDVIITKIIQSQEKSLSSFTSSSTKILDKTKEIQKRSKINQNNSISKNVINSSDDDKSLLSSDNISSSQTYSSTSYLSSSINFKIQPKIQIKNNNKKCPKKNQIKKNRNDCVHDLDDFIEQDEYDFEEEEMNSSDRNFIASESQPINDISFYRHCDIEKSYLLQKTKSKVNNTSSSESDFEISTSE